MRQSKTPPAFALLFVLTSAAPTFADKDVQTVKIINRQDKEDSYDYLAAYNTGSTLTASTKTFHVHGASLTLQLMDGRQAVVNCDSKFAEHLAGPAGNRRSCHVPLGDEVQAEFKGDNAKLTWVVSVDGKKTQSETYKILGVFDRPK